MKTITQVKTSTITYTKLILATASLLVVNGVVLVIAPPLKPIERVRPPISCGDVIGPSFPVSDVVLTKSDPITRSPCTANGLEILKPGFNLNCGNLPITASTLSTSSIGIKINSVEGGSTITNCKIKNFSDGIILLNTQNNEIRNNILESSKITIRRSNNNKIINNNLGFPFIAASSLYLTPNSFGNIIAGNDALNGMNEGAGNDTIYCDPNTPTGTGNYYETFLAGNVGAGQCQRSYRKFYEDKDKDGIVDAKDNCFTVANSDQLDTDGDGLVNVCDFDCPWCDAYPGIEPMLLLCSSGINCIDVVFVPSEDIFDQEDLFLSYVKQSIYNVYLNFNKHLQGRQLANYYSLFNFYVWKEAPIGRDGYSFVVPEQYDDIMSFADVTVRKTNNSDEHSFAIPRDSIFTTIPNDHTEIHELAHVLFDLADLYDEGDTARVGENFYVNRAHGTNSWVEEADCLSFVERNRLRPQCNQFPTREYTTAVTKVWKYDCEGGADCIMSDQYYDHFGTADAIRINEVFNNWSVYDSPHVTAYFSRDKSTKSLPLSALSQKYGMLTKFYISNNSNIKHIETKMTPGFHPRKKCTGDCLLAKILDPNGRKLDEFKIDDPRLSQGKSITLDGTSFNLFFEIPFTKFNAKYLEISDPKNQKVLKVNIDTPFRAYCKINPNQIGCLR